MSAKSTPDDKPFPNIDEKFFEVLDNVEQGQLKMGNEKYRDRYLTDLDLARKTTAQTNLTFEQSLDLLPRLWRYTLLCCSLKGQGQLKWLSNEWFENMIQTGWGQIALGVAERLPNSYQKVEVLSRIGTVLAKHPDSTSLKIKAWNQALRAA